MSQAEEDTRVVAGVMTLLKMIKEVTEAVRVCNKYSIHLIKIAHCYNGIFVP